MSEKLSLAAKAGLVYLLLVIGGILPIADGDSMKTAAKCTLLTGFVFMLVRGALRRQALQPILLFVVAGGALMSMGLYRAVDMSFAIEKIDGAILCTAALVIVVHAAFEDHGARRVQAMFLGFALLVLGLTLAYKAHFGFFDRQTRFFLNGPIVYGWLMGLCALLALHLWNTERATRWLCLFPVFVAAMAWTESKGAAIAWAAASSFYVVAALRRSLWTTLATGTLIVIAYACWQHELIELFQDSRYAAVARLIAGELTDVDDSSVGIRAALAQRAFEQFLDQPLFGIGLARFSFDGLVYPHNQHLEIFTELGLFAGMAHALFVLAALLRASKFNRAVIVFVAVASSFSGDASYLRFLYGACLLAFLPRGNKSPTRSVSPAPRASTTKAFT